MGFLVLAGKNRFWLGLLPLSVAVLAAGLMKLNRTPVQPKIDRDSHIVGFPESALVVGNLSNVALSGGAKSPERFRSELEKYKISYGKLASELTNLSEQIQDIADINKKLDLNSEQISQLLNRPSQTHIEEGAEVLDAQKETYQRQIETSYPGLITLDNIFHEFTRSECGDCLVSGVGAFMERTYRDSYETDVDLIKRIVETGRKMFALVSPESCFDEGKGKFRFTRNCKLRLKMCKIFGLKSTGAGVSLQLLEPGLKIVDLPIRDWPDYNSAAIWAAGHSPPNREYDEHIFHFCDAAASAGVKLEGALTTIANLAQEFEHWDSLYPIEMAFSILECAQRLPTPAMESRLNSLVGKGSFDVDYYADELAKKRRACRQAALNFCSKNLKEVDGKFAYTYQTDEHEERTVAEHEAGEDKDVRDIFNACRAARKRGWY